ncbi:hypothetical protein [Cupriavidus plantarum]|uniref:hypothetical protein n=1 Tax=Cupriavidus plantarum TaxID=942865 RepID=UPI000EB0CB9B|nr:hypothetical protein [Cupriavidus plantarum]RLK44553.1 hypothetical protein C7417_0536 [Cupriavidus plantarum]
MASEDWRVEKYRGKDAYVLVTPQRESVAGSIDETQLWTYQIRIAEEGTDPADAGEAEVLESGNHVFATRHAAETAAFAAAYAQIDKLLA